MKGWSWDHKKRTEHRVLTWYSVETQLWVSQITPEGVTAEDMSGWNSEQLVAFLDKLSEFRYAGTFISLYFYGLDMMLSWVYFAHLHISTMIYESPSARSRCMTPLHASTTVKLDELYKLFNYSNAEVKCSWYRCVCPDGWRSAPSWRYSWGHVYVSMKPLSSPNTCTGCAFRRKMPEYWSPAVSSSSPRAAWNFSVLYIRLCTRAKWAGVSTWCYMVYDKMFMACMYVATTLINEEFALQGDCFKSFWGSEGQLSPCC